MQDLRIAMVQMNSRVADYDGNLATIARFSEEAAAQDVDIVCFPELCVCGYNAGDNTTPEPKPLKGDSLCRLEEIARDGRITLLAGLLERDVSGIVYNTQVVCGPKGYVGHYRKTHVPDVEIGTFCHGDALPVFDHAKARYGIEICYDSHFPEVSTILAGKGAEVIFLPHASPTETREEKRARWMRYGSGAGLRQQCLRSHMQPGRRQRGRSHLHGRHLCLRPFRCCHRGSRQRHGGGDDRRRSECLDSG